MKNEKHLGKTQQKILLILLGGVALSLTRSPKIYYRTFRLLCGEWKKIDQNHFSRSFHALSKEKLIQEKILANGSFKLVLTKEGKKLAGILEARKFCAEFEKPKKWDGKWRIVMFDIPEKDRLFRSILRQHLYDLDFTKLQHSVFVSPYPCENAILQLVKVYSAQKYVRIVTAIKIDNDKKLIKKYF